MRQSKDSHIIPMTSVSSGKTREVVSDVFYYTDQIVNLLFVGTAQSWVLIDAGMPGSGKNIVRAAEKQFGKGARPQAIILTHGHFDHVGALVYLLEHWKGVLVYAHINELPFLMGRQAYPDPDPAVEGGGLLAKISFVYPHGPVDVSPAVRPLPTNETLPGMPRWRWLHTPGHAPGHISIYREQDGFLIAGDAFVTVRQDSFYKVLLQKEEVNGPPVYLTTDWDAARESVKKLAALHPKYVVAGHGRYMEGAALNEGLSKLAADFDAIAKPEHGKYVEDN